ncbi:MAG: VWA domain-containing protein [Clostridiales bacterium]|nr:VWA domain-containing protein [Clostridiales bacterium]
MNPNRTELVFILDRSGSMQGLESDTIGGFNGMLRKQKALEGEVLVSTVLFSDAYHRLHDRVPIQQVAEMTQREYSVGGCTALLDAVGRTIDHIDRLQRLTPEPQRPGKTIFVITTDGQENASREYNRAQVKTMIKLRQEEFDWEFFFLGANMDAVAAAGAIGIHASRAAGFVNDSMGTQTNFDAVNQAVAAVRRREPLSEAWKAPIEQDKRRRGSDARG